MIDHDVNDRSALIVIASSRIPPNEPVHSTTRVQSSTSTFTSNRNQSPIVLRFPAVDDKVVFVVVTGRFGLQVGNGDTWIFSEVHCFERLRYNTTGVHQPSPES